MMRGAFLVLNTMCSLLGLVRATLCLMDFVGCGGIAPTQAHTHEFWANIPPLWGLHNPCNYV